MSSLGAHTVLYKSPPYSTLSQPLLCRDEVHFLGKQRSPIELFVSCGRLFCGTPREVFEGFCRSGRWAFLVLVRNWTAPMAPAISRSPVELTEGEVDYLMISHHSIWRGCSIHVWGGVAMASKLTYK